MTDLAHKLAAYHIPHETLTLVFAEHAAPIYALTAPQAETFSLWQRLRTHSTDLGYWPLIIGHADTLEDFRSIRRFAAQSWEIILRDAQRLNPVELLVQRENRQRRILRTAFRDFGLARHRPDLTNYPTDTELEHYLDDYYAVLAQELGWEADADQPSKRWSPSDTINITDQPRFMYSGLNSLLLVPTTVSWHVPAYLYLSDGSGLYADLVCILRHWAEEYHLELMAAGNSSIELHLTHQLAHRHQARRLAWEMALIAPEPARIYDIEKHAAQILGGQRFWSFWWD